jgi:molybdopterin adenylyltransferase
MSTESSRLLKFGVVTVSDRASKGIYEDLGGPAVEDYLRTRIADRFMAIKRLIPDEQATIEQTLRTLADEEKCSLIITTGGTGPAPRDVTPEATIAICEKLLPGIGEVMRRTSIEYVATAMLSRQTAGIRGQSLIINLPGSPKAIAQCMDAILMVIPHCIQLIGGPKVSLVGSEPDPHHR